MYDYDSFVREDRRWLLAQRIYTCIAWKWLVVGHREDRRFKCQLDLAFRVLA